MCNVANCVPVKTITPQQMPKGTGGREALGIEGLGTGPSAAPPPTLLLPQQWSVPAALRNTCNLASTVSSQAVSACAYALLSVRECSHDSQADVAHANMHCSNSSNLSLPPSHIAALINYELVIAQLDQARMQKMWEHKLALLRSSVTQFLILSQCICFFCVSHIFLCISVCLCVCVLGLDPLCDWRRRLNGAHCWISGGLPVRMPTLAQISQQHLSEWG